MTKLDLIKKVITQKTARNLLLAKKYSPEISMILGTICFGGCIYFSCKSTIVAKEITQEMKNAINDSKFAKEDGVITEKEYKSEMTQTYVNGGLELAKIYAKPIGLGLLSIGLFYNGHRIMKGRNLALAAAYKAVDETFKTYRGRVVDEFGIEKDRQFRYGLKKEEIITLEQNDKGKTKEIKNVIETVDNLDYSQYARFYDQSCKAWSKTPEYNLSFLRAQQTYANDLLYARGHVFLNEVYDALGIERSKAGAVVGWVLDKNKENKIDFGIFDSNKRGARNFVNGVEPVILLDFNVDGVIFDLI